VPDFWHKKTTSYFTIPYALLDIFGIYFGIKRKNIKIPSHEKSS